MPGGMQGMDLQRQSVNPYRVFETGCNQTCDGMDIKQHSCFETQLNNRTPLSNTQLDKLISERDPCSLGILTSTATCRLIVRGPSLPFVWGPGSSAL